MNNPADENEEEPSEEREALDRLLREALRREERSSLRPATTSVKAYLSGTATEQQVAEVQAALARSSRFRWELLDLAKASDITTAATVVGDEADDVSLGVPERRASLRRYWAKRLLPFLFSHSGATRYQGWSWGSPNLRAALATLVVGLVLGYPAYLGLRVPKLRGELDRLREGREELDREIAGLESDLEHSRRELQTTLEAVGGRVEDWLFVGDVERGEEKGRVIRVSSKDVFVVLYLQSVPPHSGRVYRVEIRNPSGQRVWSDDVEAEDLQRDRDSGLGLTTFQVPASLLAPGRYQIVQFRVDQGPGVPLQRLMFEVKSKDSSAEPKGG